MSYTKQGHANTDLDGDRTRCIEELGDEKKLDPSAVNLAAYSLMGVWELPWFPSEYHFGEGFLNAALSRDSSMQ